MTRATYDPAPLLSRRAVIGGSLALAAGLAGGLPAASAAPAGPTTPRGLAPGRSQDAACAFLDAMTDRWAGPGAPRLAQSYSDQNGLFSTAFVYDNALAVCAYLGGTRKATRTRAVQLGDGLLYAMDHDPGYSDGRLRQAYNVGPYTFYDGSPQPYGFVLPDGDANIGWQFGFLGTAVGDMAWPGIALVQLGAREKEERFTAGAVRIARWIVDNAYSTLPLGGFSFGVDAANHKVLAHSTEHNIDCYAFFTMLTELTGDGQWTEHAEHALAFVEEMWEPGGGFFYTGSNDGIAINPSPKPLDVQTWSWLALRDDRFAASLDWAGSTLAVTDTPTSPGSQLPAGTTFTGVTFSDVSKTSGASYNGLPVDPDGVWLEGTGQLVCALVDRDQEGDSARAQALLAQVRGVQATLGGGQTVGGQPVSGGIVAASSLLDTGFGFSYAQSQHVGATSWYLMGSRHKNPMQYREL
ncbi:hypothetical protein CLV35_3876 [Motilibacter peucedani]|uniref:Tat pathway signal sequence domain protein n=1 Tax=Motilibacter peucedani TaxID=598650 RepID=A0A420XJV3_9ACTN|nr:Tat pathway signal sequence domain protein [Motilibacter peucedani]RKS67969.1 hypothetical protein CLV35_3876 [Motilibacter peucedani]